MNLEQFFSQRQNAPSGAFNSRHYYNQGLPDEVIELAHRGMKLFPVSLAAKLAGDPDRFIASATDDILLLQELSAATQPVWGYRLSLGPSGLCVLILDGAVGRASFAALVPDLDECLTLQGRRGDAVFAFFRQPAGRRRILSRKLASGVNVLGDGAGFDVPSAGAPVWLNPGAEIEALPYSLCELFASNPPDSPPGRAMAAPRPSPRSVPCRPAVRYPQPNRAPRKGHPVYGRADWRRGISRRR